jgi:hypothetical protein
VAAEAELIVVAERMVAIDLPAAKAEAAIEVRKAIEITEITVVIPITTIRT